MWNLVFPVFTLTHCMECVWKSSLWIGIFQRATQRPRTQLTDNIQRGRSCFSCVNYYLWTTDSVWRVRLIFCYHRPSNRWMPVLRGYIVIIIITRRNHSQLPAQHSPHYSLRLLLSCCLLQSYLHLDFSSEDTLYGCWQLNVSWH